MGLILLGTCIFSFLTWSRQQLWTLLCLKVSGLLKTSSSQHIPPLVELLVFLLVPEFVQITYEEKGAYFPIYEEKWCSHSVANSVHTINHIQLFRCWGYFTKRICKTLFGEAEYNLHTQDHLSPGCCCGLLQPDHLICYLIALRHLVLRYVYHSSAIFTCAIAKDSFFAPSKKPSK